MFFLNCHCWVMNIVLIRTRKFFRNYITEKEVNRVSQRTKKHSHCTWRHSTQDIDNLFLSSTKLTCLDICFLMWKYIISNIKKNSKSELSPLPSQKPTSIRKNIHRDEGMFCGVDDGRMACVTQPAKPWSEICIMENYPLLVVVLILQNGRIASCRYI